MTRTGVFQVSLTILLVSVFGSFAQPGFTQFKYKNNADPDNACSSRVFTCKQDGKLSVRLCEPGYIYNEEEDACMKHELVEACRVSPTMSSPGTIASSATNDSSSIPLETISPATEISSPATEASSTSHEPLTGRPGNDSSVADSLSIDESSSTIMENSTATVDNSSAAMDTSSAAMDTSSATMDNSSATMDNSSATMDNSSATMDTSSATMDTSSATMDTSSATMDNSSATMDNSSATMDNSSATTDHMLSTILAGSASSTDFTMSSISTNSLSTAAVNESDASTVSDASSPALETTSPANDTWSTTPKIEAVQDDAVANNSSDVDVSMPAGDSSSTTMDQQSTTMLSTMDTGSSDHSTAAVDSSSDLLETSSQALEPSSLSPESSSPAVETASMESSSISLDNSSPALETASQSQETSSLTTTTAQVPELPIHKESFTCGGRSKGNYINPENPCSDKYFTCTSDGRMSTSNCNDGLVFDRVENQCNTVEYVADCLQSTTIVELSSTPVEMSTVELSPTTAGHTIETFCENKVAGDYKDPLSNCTQHFYTCTEDKVLIVRWCLFEEYHMTGNTCLPKDEVPGCNEFSTTFETIETTTLLA